jgi:hypothetical protein
MQSSMQSVDMLKRLDDSLDRERVLIEHVAKLEALLDRVEHMPHHTITDGGGFMVVICKPYCPRCAWERMKGGKEA